MAIPDNFGPDEQFQDACKRVVNKLVRERFKDITLDDGDVDLTSARGALKTACTHQDKDSMPLTIGRLLLFTNICGFGLEQVWDLFGGEIERKVAGIKHLPQVKLFFRENAFEVDPDFLPLTATVSWRIVGESSDTFSRAKAESLANQIKNQFTIPTYYKWKKGKELYTYKDDSKGYNFQLYVFNKAEAVKVIRACMDINGGIYDEKLLNKHGSENPSDAYPTLPTRRRVMGEMVQQPRIRAVGNVTFLYAQLSLSGRIKPVTLVDTTYSFPNALVRN